MARVNTFPRRDPLETDIVGGEDSTGSTPTAGFEIGKIKELVNKRPLKSVVNGYTLAVGDDAFVIQMSTPAISTIAFIAASSFKNGTIVTIKAHSSFETLLNPFTGNIIEGVPNGDFYCLPAGGSVSLITDGSSRWFDIGVIRNGLELTNLGGAVNIPVVGRFSTATLSATAKIDFILDVVGGYQNERFIAGDVAFLSNVGTLNNITVKDNALTTLGVLTPGDTALLICVTIPAVAGAGTWRFVIISGDGVANKSVFYGANQLDISGLDGADKRTFPASTNTTIYYPVGEDKACRLEMRVPDDYDDTGGNALHFQMIFSPETASTGKTTRLQFQRTNYRPGVGDTIGGVPSTSADTAAVPEVINEVGSSTVFSFTSPSILAGEYLSLKFARLGTDSGNDTYPDGIQLSGILFTY
jgi:hypothetical protein